MSAAKTIKYLRIYEEIAEQIQNGVLKPGDRLPGTQELVEYYGTSIQTIRQAVNQLTKNGLVRTSQGKGTFVSDTAQNKVHAMPSIRLIIATNGIRLQNSVCDDPFLREICIQTSALGMTANVTILGTHQTLNEQLQRENLDALKNGLILVSAGQVLSGETLALLRENRIPYALIPHKKLERMPQVRSDGLKGWIRCFQELLTLGHRKILILPGNNSLQDVVEAASGLGVSISAENIIPITSADEKSAYGAIRRAVDSSLDFSAIICSGDYAILGAAKALRDCGLNVPQDISLVGYDRFPWLDKILPYRVNGCQQDIQGIARAILALVEEQHKTGMEILRDVQIPMDYMPGESCAIHPDGIRKMLDRKNSSS